MKPTLQALISLPVLAAALLCAASGVRAGPAEDLRAAEVAAERADMQTAIALLRKAADQNNAVAQARLADLMLAGEYEKEALELYRKSAAQGEAAGEFGLGRMYANGAAVKRDEKLALEWYRKAQAKKYAPALEALANAYREGDLGLPKDIAQADALDLQRGVTPRPPPAATAAKGAKK
jgi:TPR repeat protein